MEELKTKKTVRRSDTVKVEEGNFSSTSRIKPPTYDGKTSWDTYKKQFDAAASVNKWWDEEKATAVVVALRGEALDIFKTLTEDKYKDYRELVLHLEMRFGNKHLQQMYQAQLKGRNRRVDESLQQYEADIARLVHLAYPKAPQDFMEQLGVQIFIDGILDHQTQQTLRFARCKILNEALPPALEFNAAKQASNGHVRVRQIRTYDRSNKDDGYQRSRNRSSPASTEEQDYNQVVNDFLNKLFAMRDDMNTKKSGRPPGKLQLVRFQGQMLTRTYQAPPSRIKVSRLRHDGTSLIVYGKICGRDSQMVIDTGSYHTIVNPKIVTHCRLQPTTRNFTLETAGGETLPVTGVHHAEFCLGRTVFRHEVFVADIVDDVLIGLGLMEQHGFHLNLPGCVLKTRQEKIVLSKPQPLANSETIVKVNLDGHSNDDVDLIKPDTESDELAKRGVLVARTLTREKQNIVNFQEDHVQKNAPTVHDLEFGHPCRRISLINDDDWDKKKFAFEQRQDDTLRRIVEWKEVGQRPSWKDISDQSPAVKGYWTIWDSLILEDGILKRVWEIPYGRERRKQLVSKGQSEGDARANTEGFHEDDEVWFYNPARKKGKCTKLQKSWEGPYKVIKRLNDGVYRIQRGPRAKMKVVHLDRLAPYSRADEEE
ncbi:hypothetical protein NQ318_017224 [Aromia moschata]|uniref:Integrase p58-like C-terminal domain-containing protein n=1 Tax=Aromia moschata TaxID=1265417 RepID=A0AAV8YN45_9CUCU|nr:hypothetical protein NQ318_017224 [Aromia moschata]